MGLNKFQKRNNALYKQKHKNDYLIGTLTELKGMTLTDNDIKQINSIMPLEILYILNTDVSNGIKYFYILKKENEVKREHSITYLELFNPLDNKRYGCYLLDGIIESIFKYWLQK